MEQLEDFILNNRQLFERLAGRQGNRWCEFEKGIDGQTKRVLSRYCAINWNNRHTIEIRIFRSSKMVHHVLGRIELVMAMIDILKN